MIFKEAVGAVRRFVADQASLPAELREGPDTLESWADLTEYLSDLYAVLDAADKATGTPGEHGGPMFEFYSRGLARIREYARAQS